MKLEAKLCLIGNVHQGGIGLGETHLIAGLNAFIMGNNNFTVTTQTAIADNSLCIVSLFFKFSINILFLYKYPSTLSTLSLCCFLILFSPYFLRKGSSFVCYFLLY